MNIKNKTIWQQAAGDKDRDYSQLCLEWDVILNGPGNFGPWPKCLESLKVTNISKKKLSDLKRFCETMKNGDIVILRRGTSEILGVGIIVGKYEWNAEFGDIDGWDIHHIRRVKWLWKNYKNPEKFNTYTLKLGDTTQKLTSNKVLQWIETLKEPSDMPKPIDLPQSQPQHVSFQNISEYLFDKGVDSGSINNLRNTIEGLKEIARWYLKNGNPSESETIAYLISPLLQTLGWTPQKIGIEWNKVDVALFTCLPRSDSTLAVVIEAKRKDNSCLTAFSQAESYAKNKKNCNLLIVTDGMRYGIYTKTKGDYVLYAYMNILKLKLNYPIYKCKGVCEAMFAMTPEWHNKNP